MQSEEATSQTASKKKAIEKSDTTNAINFNFGNEMNSGKATEFDIKKETKKVSLSGTELRGLKSQLIKYVKEDKLYFGKSNLITLEYYIDSLKINYKTIQEPSLDKYLKILAKYDISHGPDRKIIVDKKYIMAGDFTKEGFEGSALGRAMEITFRESQGTISSVYDGIFKARTGPMRQINFSAIDEPKREGGLIFQKNEPQENEELNINAGSPLFSMSSEILNQSYAFRGHLKTSDRAATIFDEDHRDSRIIVSTRRLKSLRRELYKQLLSDQLIEKKGSNVRISLEPSTFSINNQELSAELEKKYLRLLSKYRIRPGQFNKLLLSSDFVVVGAFENTEFHGSVMGNIETDKILGSILEEDFKGVSIFGF